MKRDEAQSASCRILARPCHKTGHGQQDDGPKERCSKDTFIHMTSGCCNLLFGHMVLKMLERGGAKKTLGSEF